MRLGKENKLVKEIKAILAGKQQDKFIIEGEVFIREVAQHARITTLVLSEDAQVSHINGLDTQPDSVQVHTASSQLFKTLTDTQSPQGILAVFEKPVVDVSMLTPTVALILDNIQDPGNLGTMIRTAVCFGVEVIYLSAGCVDVYNPKVLRATAGASFKLPVVQQVDTAQLIGKLQTQGVQVLATTPHTDTTCYDVDLTAPVALVMGNEGKGLSPAIQALCDKRIKIPIKNLESLNVGVACGILLCETFHQRLLTEQLGSGVASPIT